jgi:hypothetical protein
VVVVGASVVGVGVGVGVGTTVKLAVTDTAFDGIVKLTSPGVPVSPLAPETVQESNTYPGSVDTNFTITGSPGWNPIAPHVGSYPVCHPIVPAPYGSTYTETS